MTKVSKLYSGEVGVQGEVDGEKRISVIYLKKKEVKSFSVFIAIIFNRRKQTTERKKKAINVNCCIIEK